MEYTSADLKKQPLTLWQEAQEQIKSLTAKVEKGKKIQRKLARWLPFSIEVINYCHRPDMPEALIHDQMTPEDWIQAAKESLKDDS